MMRRALGLISRIEYTSDFCSPHIVCEPGLSALLQTIENTRPEGRVFSMAGDEGFEPPNGGTRTRCLTTWRIPKLVLLYHIVRKNAIMILSWRKRKMFLQKKN